MARRKQTDLEGRIQARTLIWGVAFDTLCADPKKPTLTEMAAVIAFVKEIELGAWGPADAAAKAAVPRAQD